MSRRFLHIALPSPLRRRFDYIWPAKFGNAPVPGARVRVPFGRRDVIGIITGVGDHSEVPPEKLKPATDLLDLEPVLPATLFTLCTWAAEYYQHPLGEVFSTALPVLLRQGESLRAAAPQAWRLTPLGQAVDAAAFKRAPRQATAWQALHDHPAGLGPLTQKALEIDRSVLLQLLKKDLAEEFTPEAHAYTAPTAALREAHHALNAEQQAAVSAVLECQNRFQTFLLAGVTGSGKTEVYLQLIEAELKAGRQCLVLVPEIGLTPQTVARFRARFQAEVAVLHSGLTELERLKAWRAAREGRAGIIIGTRSAIFTPMRHPGLIIVDEEHDLSFKQQDGFRYHARDLAVRRGQLENIPVLLGTATPSLETLHNAQQGRYQWLRLTGRAAGNPAPLFRVLDVRARPLKEGLSKELVEVMRSTLARGEQVLVFINRRGFAPVILCHNCGWQAHCRRCDARPTLHRDPLRLHCHHCGLESAPPRQCPDCGGSELKPIGVGTERMEAALKALFPKTALYRIDRDSTRRKQAMSEMYEALQSGEPALLVGTQMLAKGHHFPAVTLVAILDVDGGLFGADFRAAERTAQLIVQVSGRAGRANIPGQVILQTHQPDHPLLQLLITQGFNAFAESALTERRLMGLPPFGYLALIRAEATSQELPLQVLEAAARGARMAAGKIEVWGPVPAPMEKKAGRFRAHLLLKAGQRAPLHQALPQVLADLEALPEARKVRWSIDVDPQELA
jgi:primosomal protein N' (replication factor Y)